MRIEEDQQDQDTGRFDEIDLPEYPSLTYLTYVVPGKFTGFLVYIAVKRVVEYLKIRGPARKMEVKTTNERT